MLLVTAEMWIHSSLTITSFRFLVARNLYEMTTTRLILYFFISSSIVGDSDVHDLFWCCCSAFVRKTATVQLVCMHIPVTFTAVSTRKTTAVTPLWPNNFRHASNHSIHFCPFSASLYLVLSFSFLPHCSHGHTHTQFVSVFIVHFVAMSFFICCSYFIIAMHLHSCCSLIHS